MTQPILSIAFQAFSYQFPDNLTNYLDHTILSYKEDTKGGRVEQKENRRLDRIS